MRTFWKGTAAVGLVAGVLMSSFTVPAAVAAPPNAAPVDVKYVVDGVAKGSGPAFTYKGGVYVPLSAVKLLTGEQASWDAATSTVSVSGPPSAKGLAYLEDLAGQPYYAASRALCWQTGKDGRVAAMGGLGGSTCNVGLPALPSLGGQRYPHEMEVLVSASGAKTAQPANSVTESYSLYGRYSRLSGMVGFLDNLKPERMAVEFFDYGKLLYKVTLGPGSLAVHFNVDVAHVQVLTLVVANVSGAAPNEMSGSQYVPGAVVIADPALVPAANG